MHDPRVEDEDDLLEKPQCFCIFRAARENSTGTGAGGQRATGGRGHWLFVMVRRRWAGGRGGEGGERYRAPRDPTLPPSAVFPLGC